MGITPLAPNPPQTRRRHRLAAVALTVAAVPAVVGCGANFQAQTNIPYQPADGVSSRVGGVFALNTLVVTDSEGNGTVVTRLVNQQDQDDAVESISATDSEGNEIIAAELADPIPLGVAPSPDQSVQVGTEGLLRLTGDNLLAGSVVNLTFTFSDAAPLAVQVPVLDVGTNYTDVPVGPVESESTDDPEGAEATE